MATKAKRHVHQYHKIIIAGVKVWACALPDCNHYMPAHMESMVKGKNSICWLCRDRMILDAENMKLDEPVCEKHSDTYIPPEDLENRDLLVELSQRALANAIDKVKDK